MNVGSEWILNVVISVILKVFNIETDEFIPFPYLQATSCPP
jgi:hypothetical protein